MVVGVLPERKQKPDLFMIVSAISTENLCVEICHFFFCCNSRNFKPSFLIACCDHKRRVAMCLALPAPSLEKKACAEAELRYNLVSMLLLQDLLQVHASQSTCQLPQEACSRGLWKPEHGNGCRYSTRSEMQFQLKLNVLLFCNLPNLHR